MSHDGEWQRDDHRQQHDAAVENINGDDGHHAREHCETNDQHGSDNHAGLGCYGAVREN